VITNWVRPSPVPYHNFLRHGRESVLAGLRLIPVVSPSSLRGVLGMRVYSGMDLRPSGWHDASF
jgi:hypothetical protein